MTGILTMKFNKELILNQTIDAQYTFIAYDIKKAKSINLPKTGVSYLKDYFSKVSDFSRREIILRSAFPNVFGNFYAKFGILLNCIAYFGKSCSNLLILGESGTGKSTFVTALNRLFSPNIKTLNGALTYKSCLNKSFLKNSTTGNFEAGLLESQDLLCFDDFHVLKDKPLIFKAMESRSILCFVTLLDDSQLISKSKYEFNICKGGKLTPEMDRFDLILKLMRNDTNVEFCIRKLSDLDMEDSSNIWDIDTIRSYMHSLLRPLDEITIQDRRIESLLGKFIEYMITFNMKVTYDNAPSGMSVRLLESIIKLTKANAILMGHGEVTLEDTYDILLLIYLSTQDDSSILNQVYIDPVLHREQIEMLKFNIELCVGPIM